MLAPPLALSRGKPAGGRRRLHLLIRLQLWLLLQLLVLLLQLLVLVFQLLLLLQIACQ